MQSNQVKWCIYNWIPERGDEYIHPDEIEMLKKLQPAGKVFQIQEIQEGWVILKYKQDEYRVKPDLLQIIPMPCFSFGETVAEKARPERVGKVRDMLWHYKRSEVMYFLEVNNKKTSKIYFCDELFLI